MPDALPAQKTLEERLRACESRLKAIVEHTPNVSIQGYTVDGRILFWNKSSEHVFGWRAEEAIGKKLEQLIFTKEEGAKFAVMLREIQATKKAVGPIEFRFDRRNGQQGWCLSTVFEIPGESDGANFICMDVDITERKAAEDALRASEELFSKAFCCGPDMMSVSDLETGRFIEINDTHAKLVGFARHEIIGRSPMELGMLENPADHHVYVAELKTHGRVRDFEVRAQNRQGKLFIVSVSAELVQLGGRTCVLRVTRDITAKKAADEALRSSEERFELAVRGSNDGIWDWNILTGEIYHSPRYSELLRYEPGEFPGVLDSLISHLHPEDRERALAAIQAHQAARVPYDIEYRLRTKDGQYRWFRSRGQAIWNSEGKAVRMSGSLTDIHERKAAEDALRLAQGEALLARQEFTQRLISAQEQERRRLASELHDSLGQNLSLIKNRIQLALSEKGLGDSAVKHLDAAAKGVGDALNEVRSLAHHLRPLPIEEFGLTDSLESLVQEMADSSSIHFEHRFEQVDDLFPGEQATMVYRILQEALNNMIKHSKATSASVTIERDLHCVRIKVEDNGRGFNRADVLGARKTRTGIGLTSIDERVRMLGGSLNIRSGPGRGTALEIEVLLPEAAGVAPLRLAEAPRSG
jgi:two-component system sensor histidine kinase UhpB